MFAQSGNKIIGHQLHECILKFRCYFLWIRDNYIGKIKNLTTLDMSLNNVVKLKAFEANCRQR
jgi:hypothetical protein